MAQFYNKNERALMKFVLIATLLSSSAFALNYEAIIATQEKYCELNVKAACDAVYCADKSTKCMTTVEQGPAGEKRAMEILMKKCGKDKECLIKETAASN